MKARFEILRRRHGEERSYVQTIEIEIPGESATVATALTQMNETPGLTDVEGRPVGHIFWECSCLQKRCGACAMRVDGKPVLACNQTIRDCKGPVIRLEPLKKFPVVADLIVDRSVLWENLKQIHLWLDDAVEVRQNDVDTAYEASRCLQCGCCLEICPNFLPGGMFAGTAAMVPVSRLIAELPRDKRREIYKLYDQRFYAGCGKSLACRNICPAGIDVDGLLVNSNAIAVWKRALGWKKGRD